MMRQPPGRFAYPTVLGLTVLLAAPSIGLADRPATPEERTAIEAVMRAEGYTSWEEIDYEDEDGHVWEVDDALAPDGRRYDVRLDADLNIVERDPD